MAHLHHCSTPRQSQHLQDRPGHNPQVHVDRPVADVGHIQGHPSGIAGAVAPGNLPQSGQPRPHVGIGAVMPAVLFDFRPDDGARTDQAHVPAQDVSQLRQLVNTRAAQPVADPGDAGIVLQLLLFLPLPGAGCILFQKPPQARFGVDPHGAEFDDAEGPTVLSQTFLGEKGRPRAVEADQHVQQAHQRQHGQAGGQAKGDVEGPLEAHAPGIEQLELAGQKRHAAQAHSPRPGGNLVDLGGLQQHVAKGKAQLLHGVRRRPVGAGADQQHGITMRIGRGEIRKRIERVLRQGKAGSLVGRHRDGRQAQAGTGLLQTRGDQPGLNARADEHAGRTPGKQHRQAADGATPGHRQGDQGQAPGHQKNGARIGRRLVGHEEKQGDHQEKKGNGPALPLDDLRRCLERHVDLGQRGQQKVENRRPDQRKVQTRCETPAQQIAHRDDQRQAQQQHGHVEHHQGQDGQNRTRMAKASA